MKPTRSPVAIRLPQPKHLLFLLIALMMLVVLVRDRILLDSQHPVWKHYEPFKWWLLPHESPPRLPFCWGRCSSLRVCVAVISIGTGFPGGSMSPGLRSACRWGS